MLAGKRVLITGGLGFIGSNLVHYCRDLGANVTIYDCLDPRSGGNMYNIRSIKKDVEIVLNDIRNFEGLSAAVIDQDFIFNCAAYTSHPQSMKDPYVDIDVNCKGTINLLEAVRRFNPETKVVHVGTSTQIGRMHLPKVDELHPEFPLDIYSANKSAAEKYVLIYGHAYGLRTSVVRLANVFGPRSNIKSSDFGFMNFFIGLGLKKKEITIFGEGLQQRTITYVSDVVSALVQAAVSDAANGQVFFAVAERQYTVAEIAQNIVSIMGGALRFIEWPKDRQAIEIGDAIIGNEKIQQVLGWSAEVDLQTGLTKTREYFEPLLPHYLD